MKIFFLTLFLCLQLFQAPFLFASDFTTAPDSSRQTPGMTFQQAVNLQGEQGQSNHAVGVDLGSPFEKPQWSPWNSALSPVKNPEEPKQNSKIIGRALHVSRIGSDTSDGSESAPWASVQYAVSKLQPGDTLFIHEGVYTETVTFGVSGRSDAFISMAGIGHVIFDGAGQTGDQAALNTGGHDYLWFRNLSVKNRQTGIEVSPRSDHIEIEDFNSDQNQTAIRIRGGRFVTVRHSSALGSEDAFAVYGRSRNLVFENIEAGRSRNGFFFDRGASNVILRNIVSHDNREAGLVIKAGNVLIQNAVAYGNRNNFETWGMNITIENSLSHHALRGTGSDGGAAEGNGIAVKSGRTQLLNVTLADNADHEMKIDAEGALWIENSIVARHASREGGLLENNGGLFSSENGLWFQAGGEIPSDLSPSDHWADPQFVDGEGPAFDYHLKSGSPAINQVPAKSQVAALDLDLKPRRSGEAVDLGAYEFQIS